MQSLWYAVENSWKDEGYATRKRKIPVKARGLRGQIGWPAMHSGGFLLVGGTPSFINHAPSRPHTAFFFFPPYISPPSRQRCVYRVCVCVCTHV